MPITKDTSENMRARITASKERLNALNAAQNARLREAEDAVKRYRGETGLEAETPVGAPGTAGNPIKL